MASRSAGVVGLSISGAPCARRCHSPRIREAVNWDSSLTDPVPMARRLSHISDSAASIWPRLMKYARSTAGGMFSQSWGP